jgi:hypothetical protein
LRRTALIWPTPLPGKGTKAPYSPPCHGARAGMQRDGRRIPFQFSCYAEFAGVDVAGREPPETVNHFVAANVPSKRSTLRSLARSPANPPYALLLTHSASISAASRWPGSLLPPSVAPPGSPAGSRHIPKGLAKAWSYRRELQVAPPSDRSLSKPAAIWVRRHCHPPGVSYRSTRHSNRW